MVFTIEGFSKVFVESRPEWDLNPRLLTTEIYSDALTDWAITPWVQLALISSPNMKVIGCLVTSKSGHKVIIHFLHFFCYHDFVDHWCKQNKITWKPRFNCKRCKTCICRIVPSIKSFEQRTKILWRESG